MTKLLFHRRHYKAIAEAISDVWVKLDDPYSPETSGVKHMVYILSNMLGHDNPNFDHEKFEEACLPEKAI